jgi:hypothetical protein
MRFVARSKMMAHVVIGILSGTLLTGCRNQFDPPRPMELSMTPNAVEFAATHFYTFGPGRRSKDTTDSNFPHDHTVKDSDAPDSLTIATATEISVPFYKPFQIIAKITSVGESFPPMHIEPGINYIVRDWLGFRWIHPPSGGFHRLHQVPGWDFPIIPDHDHEPTLFRVHARSIGFVACLDDCGSGHCGMF